MGSATSSLSASHTSRDRLLSASSGDSSVVGDATVLHGLEAWLLSGVRETGREMGRGSIAVVAELEVRGKKVAGKRLHEAVYEAASTEKRDEMLARFTRECSFLQSVKHPNIVRFFGVYLRTDSPLPYLVTELMDTSLAARLAQRGVPDRSLYYNIFTDVALGLRYLHGLSPPVVHRDLTASNVLLAAGTQQAKISDLGVSRVLALTPTQRSQLTKTPGTLCYMPLEALVEKPQYDSTIDVFSFGVLMLHVLCGDWPIPIAPTMIDPENPDQILPVTEFERRIQFVARIAEGLEHPAIPLIRRCIHSSPVSRPDINTVSKQVIELQVLHVY